jgi:ATP-dependent DNA helicase PIF1
VVDFYKYIDRKFDQVERRYEDAPAPKPSIIFSPQQQEAIDAALSGRNCLITGPGGVGKSAVIKEIVRGLRAQGKQVAITATTGIAAIAIGGMTIHSCMGTGISGCRARQLRRMGPDSVAKAENRLGVIDTIIIDEISMATGDMTDMWDWWLGLVMGCGGTRVFGGKQIILSGDFLQLPPVITDLDTDKVKNRYAFQAECWERANFHTCYLSKSFRQDNADFVKHLNRIRRGILAEDTIEYFRPCVGRPLDNPTQLRSTNREALEYNTEKLRDLPGEQWTIRASFEGDERWFDALKKNCIAEEVLELKVGAPVLFVQNLPGAYTNGQRGTVIDIQEGVVKVEKTNGTIVDVIWGEWDIVNAQERQLAVMKQIPLKLAWAITIHKSQGMSLERVSVDLGTVFEAGMSYVSLSRAETLEGLALAAPLDPSQIITSAKCVQYYKDLVQKMKANQ